ncbi:peptidase associated/transthyretin-like domain-containing protein [Hymenobacter tenuis]
MKLSANPFHPETGRLLPVYRDAYLRGDLSTENTAAVDAYMQANSHQADSTLVRFYELKSQGHHVRPGGWVQRQFDFIRAEPQRFRQRVAALVMGGALLGGAVFAGTNLPTPASTPTEDAPTAAEVVADAPAASAMRLVTLRGKILNENGKPLVGATVLDRATGRGVSTDDAGNYAILVSANNMQQLQYGYGGYAEEEVQLKGRNTYNVTLLPREGNLKKRHWWQF